MAQFAGLEMVMAGKWREDSQGTLPQSAWHDCVTVWRGDISLTFIANYRLNSTSGQAAPAPPAVRKCKDLVLSSLEQSREAGAAGGNIAIKLDWREHNDLSCWDKLFIGLVWQVIIR